MKRQKYDEIGYWSEVKLDIIKEYAAAYTRIMAAQQDPSFTYICNRRLCGCWKAYFPKDPSIHPGKSLQRP